MLEIKIASCLHSAKQAHDALHRAENITILVYEYESYTGSALPATTKIIEHMRVHNIQIPRIKDDALDRATVGLVEQNDSQASFDSAVSGVRRTSCARASEDCT